MMPFLQTYVDNLLSNWKLHRSALNATEDVNSVQQTAANAKQEQIINDLKTLYDASLAQVLLERNENCTSLCQYIYTQAKVLWPGIAPMLFNTHLKPSIHLQTNFHGCIAD
jgi:hypothetical protein